MLQNTEIIAFAGLARVGKTTAAQKIMSLAAGHGYSRIESMSFAEPIKQGLSMMGVTKEEHPEEYRHLAQYIGTDVLRKKDNNWWANVMKRRISAFDQIPLKRYVEPADDNRLVVIDDVRFENEVEALEDLGATLIWVDPGPIVRLNLEDSVYDHFSEKFAVDYYNRGDVETANRFFTALYAGYPLEQYEKNIEVLWGHYKAERLREQCGTSS